MCRSGIFPYLRPENRITCHEIANRESRFINKTNRMPYEYRIDRGGSLLKKCSAVILRSLTIVLSAVGVSCSHSRIVENPLCEQAGNLHVLRIEAADTATIVDVAVIGYPDSRFAI